MTTDAFAEKIKTKYPQYKGVDNATLTQQFVTKYPVYASQIDKAPKAKQDLLTSASGVVNSIFPGKQIGESLVKAGTNLGNLVTGGIPKFNAGLADNTVNVPKLAGDYINAGATLASSGAGLGKTVAQSAATFGGLSGASTFGSNLAEGNDLSTTLKNTAVATGEGAVLGAGFNLLGKAVGATASKIGPASLSFTSGVPTEALTQAAANPAVSKQGLKMSVEQIRNSAVDSHSTLMKDLGSEFEQGLSEVTRTNAPAPEGVQKISSALNKYADSLANEFRVGITDTPTGPNLDFSKSSIVKGGEQSNIEDAIKTLRSWDDFSAQGVQNLAERIGALRNFEAGASTKSSAILGKIYSKIAGDAGQGVIPKYYPDLYSLRQNYRTNREVLDEIGNVLSSNRNKPTQVQASVSRLSNLYKQDREGYVNVIRQLSERSGVDYLSLLAGTEFQKVLPSFIRGLGGAGAVGIGAQLLNPFLLLLAPLFSPRVVGSVAQNAQAISQGVGKLTQVGTVKAVQESNKE